VELSQSAGARRRGIVAKLKAGRYTPEETSWVKIKNASYNQVMGRDKLVEKRLGASA
jgi:hypothetical protein